MGSIWKTVTAFFKPKMDETKKKVEDISENDDSDSDDEDFVPNAKNEAPDSEVSDEGGDEKKKTDRRSKNGKGRGKKRRGGKKGLKGRKRRKMDISDESDSEDDDVDFSVNESPEESEREEKLDPDVVAAQEALEKAHTDVLWADFLNSVDEDAKKKKEKDRTVEKVVSRVYDFAGEKVEVQEKVKVTVSGNSNGVNGSSSSRASVNLSVKNNSAKSTSSNSMNLPGPSNTDKEKDKTDVETADPDEPQPSTSQAITGNKPIGPSQRPRRGGISILGNDPEAIGLDELEKRGLSGLLKAFQTKTKKIGTLEKSKLDWESFKRKQGLEDELQHHNKSKATYIDKQEFLQRADHRQFEIEKSMRATVRSRRLAN